MSKLQEPFRYDYVEAFKNRIKESNKHNITKQNHKEV